MQFNNMSPQRRWTYEDRCILKAHYNIMPVEELATMLNRSEKALHNQVAYLRKRGWSFNRKSDEISKK